MHDYENQKIVHADMCKANKTRRCTGGWLIRRSSTLNFLQPSRQMLPYMWTDNTPLQSVTSYQSLTAVIRHIHMS